jgi:hypothetical protein
MSADPKRATIKDFLAFAKGRKGRYELMRGEIIAQDAERATHWEVKLALLVALLRGAPEKSLPRHVAPDGATMRIDETTAYWRVRGSSIRAQARSRARPSQRRGNNRLRLARTSDRALPRPVRRPFRRAGGPAQQVEPGVGLREIEG